MKRLFFLTVLVLSLASSRVASACDGEDAVPVFSCEAANGRKFIELCGSIPADNENGFMQYRFGTLKANGREEIVEMVYPAVLEGSYKHFFGAVYTYKGVYTQSVRFVSGEYSYMVFTRYNEKRHEHLGAGVEVRNRRTGKTIVVDCSERPRFYIFELQGVLPCDPETPVGKACIK